MPRKTKKQKWQKAKNAGITAGYFLCNKLLELGEVYLQSFERPYRYAYHSQGRPREILPCRLKQEIKRMKERGWIEEAEKQGKTFLKLTEKGRLHGLYKKILVINNKPKNLWDGKWRMAMFDIPERGRHERKALRKALTTAGFRQFQKSVYIYPHEIDRDLIIYLKDSNLLPFIRFARIDQMDNTEDLKKWFKL